MWEIISIILFLAICIESYFFYQTIVRSNEKIEDEQNAQADTRQRIQDLYDYLNTMKDSSMNMQDPLIQDVFRNCMGLLDYFDHIYYKKDLEKYEKIAELVKEIEDLTGTKVSLNVAPQDPYQNIDKEVIGVVRK